MPTPTRSSTEASMSVPASRPGKATCSAL
ncbi:hypothetical protein E2C01_074113 [Portunus trituberculatus]|uniref:Uncharacterized protein n=1 Tax=Portunus trituberculatus TaxID=210409 RepID=A0A5B7IFG5_PORTR|nr:hypothetical protein [Portunus trituberculatus]